MITGDKLSLLIENSEPIRNVSFEEADFSGSNFAGGMFNHVNFAGANLSCVNLAESGLVEYSLQDAVLDGANFSLCNFIDFTYADLAERVLLRAIWNQRLIEKADVSQCGTIDQTAAASFSLQAENAFITAGNAVRVDASQIHIG